MQYTLITPVKITGEAAPVTTLNVREVMRLNDLIAAREAGTDQIKIGAVLIARMCGILPEDVYQMNIRDFDALDEIVAELRSPKTPTTSETAK